MNTYAIEIRSCWKDTEDWTETGYGKTPAQAKYNVYQRCGFDDGMDFFYFLQGRVKSCRLVHKFQPSDLFDNEEHFNAMKERRGIPFAYMGQRIEVAGKAGVIVGANSSGNLDVCFDGDHERSNCHPYWETKYYSAAGEVCADYTQKNKEGDK